MKGNYEKAIFAGGCFWCIEAAFDKVEGVIATTSGYVGGKVINPSYEQVSEGNTGHYEAVEVTYDSKKVDYQKLLNIFWLNIDPTDRGGQFADRGSQYHTAIFFLDDKQKELAETSKKYVEKILGQKVATVILPAIKFYSAEEYHQNYHQKNRPAYANYYYCSGRPLRLSEIWEKAKKQLEKF